MSKKDKKKQFLRGVYKKIKILAGYLKRWGLDSWQI